MLKSSSMILAALLALPPPASAAGMKIAVVAPQSGNLEILGRQVIDGATLAAKDRAELVMIDESCADQSGPAIAQKIQQSGAAIAIGFLCSPSLEGGLPLLARANIPAISLSVRASILLSAARRWFSRPSRSASARARADRRYRSANARPRIAIVRAVPIRARRAAADARSSY